MSVKIARGRDSAGGHRTRLLLSRFFSQPTGSSADGLSQRLRRLLYRAVNIQPDPRHAERQARQYPLHSLDERLRCGLFHSPLRPKVCGSLQPRRDMCHDHRDQALIYLAGLEADTAP